MQNEGTLELRWLLAVIRRWAWLIIGFILVAVVIAFVITARLPPVYEATTTLLVASNAQMNPSDYNTVMASERLALTYSEMLKEPSTLETTIARLELDETPETLAKKIDTEVVQNTQLVRVTASAASPAQAVLIADTVADVFIAHTQTLQEARYQEYLASKEAKIESQRSELGQTQAQIDAITIEKISNETELARLQTLLADYRRDSQTLQQDLQSLQVQIERVKDNVTIVEPARVPAPRTRSPYTATVTLLVDQNGTNPGAEYTDVMASEQTAGTYAEMLSGPSILEAAIAGLDPEQRIDAVAITVTAEPVAGTQLVRLNVTGPDRAKVTLLADAMAQVFIAQIQAMLEKPYAGRLTNLQADMTQVATRLDDTQAKINEQMAAKLRNESELQRLQSVLSEYRSDYRATQQDYDQLRLTATQASDMVVITEQAHEPTKPVRNRLLYILLAAMVAVIFSIGLVVLIEYLDESIKTPEDVSHALGLSTLGMIEQFGNEPKAPIVASQPQSPAAEAFRMLATNVRLSSLDGHLRTILVTSPAPVDGKSVVVANLSIAMANVGLRVVVVDIDLRRPRLHELFGLNRTHGLTDALAQGVTNGYLKPSGVEGVRILTSGTVPQDPVGVISSPRLKKLLNDLGQEADVVIIDSPPVLSVADTTILAAGADGVLLVLRAGHTGRRPARRAMDVLRRSNTYLLGVVLNAVPLQNDGYYGRYYGSAGRAAVRHSRLRRVSGLFGSHQPQ